MTLSAGSTAVGAGCWCRELKACTTRIGAGVIKAGPLDGPPTPSAGGLAGFLYWYAVVPFHGAVFPTMLARIQRDAIEMAADPGP